MKKFKLFALSILLSGGSLLLSSPVSANRSNDAPTPTTAITVPPATIPTEPPTTTTTTEPSTTTTTQSPVTTTTEPSPDMTAPPASDALATTTLTSVVPVVAVDTLPRTGVGSMLVWIGLTILIVGGIFLLLNKFFLNNDEDES